MRNTLDNIIDALALRGSINIDACVLFMEEMLRWNKTHGLTAIVDPREVAIKHMGDSLSIHAFVKGDDLVDVGSGGGFPGIPLALLFPEKRITLVESQHKKAAFLRHIKRTLRLVNVTVVQQRVETWYPEQLFDVVTTRAFSTLLDMVTLTQHLCKHEGYFLAMKGEFPEKELLAIKNNYPFYRVERLVVPQLAAERHCVIINNARQVHAE